MKGTAEAVREYEAIPIGLILGFQQSDRERAAREMNTKVKVYEIRLEEFSHGDSVSY